MPIITHQLLLDVTGLLSFDSKFPVGGIVPAAHSITMPLDVYFVVVQMVYLGLRFERRQENALKLLGAHHIFQENAYPPKMRNRA